MAATTYTLAGYGGFFEKRRVTFVEPLPAFRVCTACGLVTPKTRLLPCGHTICDEPCGGLVSASGFCPVDGRQAPAASVRNFQLELSVLEQSVVRCLNGPDNCDFTGKLSELREHHVSACTRDLVECIKCAQSVCRDTASDHARTCRGSLAPAIRDASCAVARVIAREMACIKEDVGKLHDKVKKVSPGGKEKVERIVSSVEDLLGQAMLLEARLNAAARRSAEGTRAGDQLAADIPPPGPFRSASRRGSALTLSELGVVSFEKFSRVPGTACTLLGYTFYVLCDVDPNTSALLFQLRLRVGSWDDFVEWPFAKRVAISIPHSRNASMDIRLLPLRDQHSVAYLRPQPGHERHGIRFESAKLGHIIAGSFVHNGEFYVNVEFV